MSNSIHCEQLFERFSRFLDLFDQHGSVHIPCIITMTRLVHASNTIRVKTRKCQNCPVREAPAALGR